MLRTNLIKVSQKGSVGERPATAIGFMAIASWSALALFTTWTKGLPPFEALSLSFAVAFIVSLALLSMRGPAALSKLRQPWAAWGLSFVGIFGYHSLYFSALDSAPPAAASLIAYLWPLLIVLFAALLPGGRLVFWHLLGAMLGLGGTILLMLHGPTANFHQFTIGYVLALGCAFVWSGYSVLNRHFSSVPTEMISGVCGAVAVAGAICHLLFEPTIIPDGRQWAAVVLLGLGPVGLAFFAWDHATKRGNLPILGTLSYAAPLLSTFLLVIVGRTVPNVTLLAAAALIVGGAIIAAQAQRLGFRKTNVVPNSPAADPHKNRNYNHII